MKKFIAAFDGYQFSQSALSYAIKMAKSSHALLVGIFMEDAMYHNYSFSDIKALNEGVSDESIQVLNEKD